MQKVRFLKQFRYSPTGPTVETAQKGDELELSDELAASAVNSGAAEIIVEEEDSETSPNDQEPAQSGSGDNPQEGDGAEDPKDSEGSENGQETRKPKRPVNDKSKGSEEDK